jgi:hypothetical protein
LCLVYQTRHISQCWENKWKYALEERGLGIRSGYRDDDWVVTACYRCNRCYASGG